jgi:large subunit ribosomal protein L10
MARPEKVEQVELLSEKLKNATAAVLTDYRGLSVSQIQDLRSRFRGAEIEYRVVKNTLARRAVSEAGRDESLRELFEGPVAVAFGYGEDIGASVRLINEFSRATRTRVEVKGGLIEGRVLGPQEVLQVADLPSREVLIAQLLGTLQTPVGQLANAIQAPVRELIGLLEAYKDKLGDDGDGAAVPAGA